MRLPYRITNDILNLATEITLLLGHYEGLRIPVPQPELRKHTKIITIQSSLAIEGNTLTIGQVTDIINNKRVTGSKKDIVEVKNAIKAYDIISDFTPNELSSLLRAHKILMDGLLIDAGRLRQGNVGVKAGETVVHVAPSYKMVHELMNNLFAFLQEEKDLNPLIKSSVFHYEFEFIHPFMDGNGRVGRLWQSVILYDYKTIFEYIPVETIIHRKQMDYYKAIQESTQRGESTVFIQFMLEIIKEATIEFTKSIKPIKQSTDLRIDIAKDHFGTGAFLRKDYLRLHTSISTATASRDLAAGVQNNILTKTGKKATTKYRFENKGENKGSNLYS